MGAQGFVRATRDALSTTLARGRGRALRAAAAAVLTLFGAAAAERAEAGGFTISYVNAGDALQKAAAGNAVANPLAVRNNSTVTTGDVLFQISSDTSGGATLDGGVAQVVVTLAPGASGGPSLALGGVDGEAIVIACPAFMPSPGVFQCDASPTLTFVGKVASMQSFSGNGEGLDPGENSLALAQAYDGGNSSADDVPVTFTLSGPATATSPLTTISGSNGPAQLNFMVDPTAMPGAPIVLTATRTDVPGVAPLVYNFVVNSYALNLVSPPAGTRFQAGTTVTLTVEALFNGGPPDNERASGTVQWQIVQNPNGSTLTGGGSSASSNTNGTTQATIDLTVGMPNPNEAPLVVRATAFQPMMPPPKGAKGPVTTARTVDFQIVPFDALTFGNATGGGQSADAGTAFQNPLTLIATRNGTADVGALIDWTVTPAGAATLGANQTTTGTGGDTSNTVIAGPNGGPFTVTATFANSPAATSQTFGLTGLARRLVKPSTGSGDGQSGGPGQVLTVAAQATLNGANEAGVTVNWTVTGGDALVTTTTNPTDNAGLSSAQITLGNTPGAVTVQAQRADATAEIQTYTLTLQNTPTLVKPSTGSGDGQTGSAGQTLPQPLVAIALRNGTAQPGVTVNWTVTGGDAVVSNTTNPTDGAGRSTAQITFGTIGGPVTVQAQRADALSEIQTYTLTLQDVRTLEKPLTGSGDGQVGAPGTTLPDGLIVVARNNGQPVAGVNVQWSVSGDATLNSNLTTTASDGSTGVSLTFGSSGGTVTVTASRQDAPTATASFVVSTAARELLTLELPADSGDGVSGPPGTVVPLRALAMRNGQPDANVPVVFELVSGSGTLGRTSAITGRDGIATSQVTLGNPGPVQVRATRGDEGSASVLYSLTSTTTGAGDALIIVSGDNQSVLPGATGAPLVVRFTRDGSATAGIPVTWSVVGGDAVVAPTSSTTDNGGNAQTGIVFGTRTGQVSVRATAGRASVVFSLTIRADDTVGLSLRLISGASQTGPIGTRADLPIVVEVFGGSGQNVAGKVVEWVVLSGSAVVDGPGTLSGDDGRAQQGFRFGPSAGPIVIRARIGDGPSQFVDVPATSFVPTLAIVSGNNQSAPVSTTLPQDFVVAISRPPGAGKTLAGVTVRWQVAEGGGSLGAATSMTGADGRASNRLTLGPAAGANRVTASIDGGGSVTFTATGTVAAPVGPLAIVSGNNQTLTTRTNSAPLVVELKTTAGVPIVGASLLWTSVNAQTSTVRTTTNDQGRASNIAQVLLPGVARVTVQVEGSAGAADNSVVFLLNGGVSNIPALGPPEETIGNAIDSLCPALARDSTLSAAEADLLARCLELVNNAGDHPDQVENALVELQQDVALAQANAALIAASTQFQNVKTRIAALRSGSSGADLGGLAVATASGTMPLSFLPSSVVQAEDETEGGSEAEIGADFSRWGFFASGIVGRGEYDGRTTTPDYDYDTQGLTAGVDYRVNDAWIVGASLGYNKQDTEVSDDRGGIDTSGWTVSAYTTWYQQTNWYLDGVLSFGSNDFDLTRSIVYDIVGANGTLTRVNQLASASTSGDQTSLAASFGRDFQKGAWSYGPYLRGNYTRVEFDAYSEQLASGIGSGLGLAVDARELKSMTGVLGGKVTYAMSRDWGILMPHAQIELEHEFEDDPQSLVTRFLNDPTGSVIRVEGDDVDSNFYNIGFGLSALFPGGRSAFFYYEHLAGSEGLSQDNLSLGVRIEF